MTDKLSLGEKLYNWKSVRDTNQLRESVQEPIQKKIYKGEPVPESAKKLKGLKDPATESLSPGDRQKYAENIDADSGNPCHYQTHVGDKQGMNRQGRSSGVTCHHRKS